MEKENEKTTIEQFKKYAEKNIKQEVCPNCGYCPHCRRGGDRLYPSRPIENGDAPVTYTVS